jgi:O-phosphoseryl-tRNA(Cys) synthetase
VDVFAYSQIHCFGITIKKEKIMEIEEIIHEVHKNSIEGDTALLELCKELTLCVVKMNEKLEMIHEIVTIQSESILLLQMIVTKKEKN